LINVGELRRGVNIELDGQLLGVIDFEHIKMGRGGAVARLKLRNLRSGAIFERTFPASEKFRRAYLERRKVQFSYNEDELYHFMDTETFEDIELSRQQLGDGVSYLLENVVVDVLTYDGEPISVELPTTMEMRVVQTDPGFKGDTATGGTKPAIVETGLRVNVPLFVNEGELIRVDARDGTYIERVSER
jgi:elongation factor P